MGDLRSFFAAGKAAPIGNTRYPSGYGLTQRRHPAVPPDTTLSPRPFPSGPTALGLQLLLSRPTRPPPPAHPENPPRPEIRRPGEHRSPGKSASTGKSAGQKHRSPGKSAGQEHRSPGNPPRPENPPARLTFQQSTAGRPSFHPAPVLSGFVPLRSPSPARFTPLSPRRNTCRASPLPPNGMPHEPRRGRPVQICKPDRMPRQKERQPAGAAALRQSDSGPIICC